LKWNTHANSYYSVTPHNSFDNWLQYSIDPTKAQVKKPRISLWNRPDPKPEVRSLDELILPVLDGVAGITPSGATAPTVVVASTRKNQTTADKQAKFYKYVKEYYTENPDQVIDYFGLATLLDDYAKGGFNEMAAPQYIEYAMYNYLKETGDKVRFEDRQATWCNRVLARMKK